MIESKAAHQAYFANPRDFHLICVALFGAASIVSAEAVFAQPPKAVTGEWSSPYASEGVAVHLIAMPADTADFHTQLLWWRGRHHDPTSMQLDGGLRFWKPGLLESGQDPWTTNFTASRPIEIPAGVDIFCAGHEQLGSTGHFLIAGGTEKDGGETGVTAMRLFDPLTRGWVSPHPPSMSARRWYPTATPLPDGRVFISSGSSHLNLYLYGGLREGENSPADRSLRRYQVTDVGGHDAAFQPPPPPNPNLPYADWPRALEGHSATFLQFVDGGSTYYFGGRTDDGSAIAETRKFERSEQGDHALDYQYFIRPAPNVGTPPAARYDHSAVAIDGTRLVIWGGRDQAGVVDDNDVWILDRQSPTGPVQWRSIQIATGVGPTVRYGHAAVWDPDHNRVLVFGGAGASGVPGDASVWAFTFDDLTRQTGIWSQPQIIDPGLGQDPPDGNPPALIHHSMVSDTEERARKPCMTSLGTYRNAVLFGGQRLDGSLSNELWTLWFHDEGVNAGKLEWLRINIPSPPQARIRAGLGYDNSTGRLWVVGGRGLNAQQQPIKLSSVHRLNLHTHTHHCGEFPRVWTPLPPLAAGAEGFTCLMASAPSFPRIPEVYDPATGSVSTLPTLHLLHNWYPFNFLVDGPSGSHRIFSAGPKDSSYFFNFNFDGTQTLSNFGMPAQPLTGGSAVMFEPNKIMKCGSRDTPFEDQNPDGSATNRTQVVDLSAPSPTWVEVDEMYFGRVNHNLTVLPSGDVLCLGGTRFNNNSIATDPVFLPELWSPLTGVWQPPVLASTTLVRDYHNSAILLPDARVLQGGGNGCNETNNPGCTDDRISLQVFSPPYLYSQTGPDGNAPSTRPTILATDAGVLRPDEVFTVYADFPIDSVVLIRAGAVTHGFDQGQRLLRPALESCPECVGQLPLRSKFRLPNKEPLMPAGYYQLFAVHNGVPSISRWVYILRPNESKVGKSDVGDRVVPAKSTLSTIPTCATGYPGLLWTAPGDDSTFAGVLKEYDIREASNLCAGCWSQFGSATPLVGEPTPSPPGTAEYMSLSELTPGYPHKLQLVSRDDRTGRTSALSNVVSVIVLECDEGMSGGGGGGGGGGFAAHRSSLAASLTRETPSPAESREVTMRPLGDDVSTDLLPFEFGPRFAGDGLQVYLRRGEQGRSHVSHVQLVAVDAAAGGGLLTPDGRPLGGTRLAALDVDRGGSSAATGASASDDDPWGGRTGEQWIVRLPATDGPTPVIIRALGSRAASEAEYGIAVEVPDGASWREIGMVIPRREFSDLVVDDVLGEVIRLSFKHPHAVSRIERLLPAPEAPVVRRPPLNAAHHSRRGTIDGSAFAVDEGVVVAARETLTVDFALLPEPADGVTRSWYLEVTARHEEPERAAQFARSVLPSVTSFRIPSRTSQPEHRADDL